MRLHSACRGMFLNGNIHIIIKCTTFMSYCIWFHWKDIEFETLVYKVINHINGNIFLMRLSTKKSIYNYLLDMLVCLDRCSFV